MLVRLVAVVLVGILAVLQALRIWTALGLGRWSWLGTPLDRRSHARRYWIVTGFNSALLLALITLAATVVTRTT
jgi:hypothetical protein